MSTDHEREEPGCWAVVFWIILVMLVGVIAWQGWEIYKKVTHEIPETIHDVSTK